MTNKEAFNGLINQLTAAESMQVFEMLTRILSRSPEERAEMGKEAREKEAAEVVSKLTDEECEQLPETHSCEGCRYWRPLSATGYMACHYLLDNGHMRGGKVSDCTVREETEANEIKKPRSWRDGKGD